MPRHVTDTELDWIRETVEELDARVGAQGLTTEARRYLIDEIGSEVQRRNLWAPHLPTSSGGGGFTWMSLARIFEVLGASEYAPIGFGCWPPDSVNATLLHEAGSEAQKREWLEPLVAGSITSAFAMTEPTSGSDPTRLEGKALQLDDGGWVLSGTKWWITNGSRADVYLGLFVTDPDGPPRRRTSVFIIPSSSPGLEIVRDIGHIATRASSKPPVDVHTELNFDGVRVGPEALVGSQGDGFRLAQIRLSAARLQHCMRWVGLAERAFQLMCLRAESRVAHGSRLADKSTIQRYIADAATRIHLSRLLVMDAAASMDERGQKESRQLIAMSKVFVARTLSDVVDNAIQVHGAMGVSDELPLESIYRYARLARIFDGPDEVHEMTISRLAVRRFTEARGEVT